MSVGERPPFYWRRQRVSGGEAPFLLEKATCQWGRGPLSIGEGNVSVGSPFLLEKAVSVGERPPFYWRISGGEDCRFPFLLEKAVSAGRAPFYWRRQRVSRREGESPFLLEKAWGRDPLSIGVVGFPLYWRR